MACADPTAITGGSVITTGPYADGSVAVFSCNTGYVMSGTAFITCTTGTWSTSPSCALQYQQNINITTSHTDNTDFPSWLTYFVASVFVLLAILFIVCILVCCFQLCGYYGEGGLFGHPIGCGYVRCCSCCKSDGRSYRPRQKQCTTFPRRYHYDENGHRFHIDDLGRRCYYEHKNKSGRIVTVTSVTPETESSVTDNTVIVNENWTDKERKVQPAKELLTWKPHMHPVRKINTSTK